MLEVTRWWADITLGVRWSALSVGVVGLGRVTQQHLRASPPNPYAPRGALRYGARTARGSDQARRGSVRGYTDFAALLANPKVALVQCHVERRRTRHGSPVLARGCRNPGSLRLRTSGGTNPDFDSPRTAVGCVSRPTLSPAFQCARDTYPLLAPAGTGRQRRDGAGQSASHLLERAGGISNPALRPTLGRT